MRDRLIELLWCIGREYDEYCEDSHEVGLSPMESFEEMAADHLLAAGVIVPQFKAGDHIWVIDTEDGEAVDVSCVQYVANCKNCVIATAFIDDYDFDETLDYHISETQERFDAELKVYPEADCFPTREAAEKALAERREG